VQLPDGAAAGDLPDPLDDLGPVQEKLVPDDGVARVDYTSRPRSSIRTAFE
jgi:hypothetical protein